MCIYIFINKYFVIIVEFVQYLRYCRGLRFEERPDYSYLRQLFRTLFHEEGFTYDYVFDWNRLKFGNVRQQTLSSTQQTPMQSQHTNAALPSGTNNDQEHRSRLVFRDRMNNISANREPFAYEIRRENVSNRISLCCLSMHINSMVISLPSAFYS